MCLYLTFQLSRKIFDKPEVVKEKVALLAKWLRSYNGSCILHVGAGLSTAAGIRDFRGKKGVWTELRNKSMENESSSSLSRIKQEAPKKNDQDKPDIGQIKDDQEVDIVKPFDDTVPTYSHMALKELCSNGLVKHIVSQNVDGLFLKSNLNRSFISELHGNFYLDECTKCRSRFIRSKASQTMRLEKSPIRCPRGIEACKGYLRDTILDWESPIPYNEMRVATRESKHCKLHICIGSSLQLRPSKDLVCGSKHKQKDEKLVIINLQPTKFDSKADLIINYYADFVMKELMSCLNIDVPNYDLTEDPTKNFNLIGTSWKK